MKLEEKQATNNILHVISNNIQISAAFCYLTGATICVSVCKWYNRKVEIGFKKQLICIGGLGWGIMIKWLRWRLIILVLSGLEEFVPVTVNRYRDESMYWGIQ